MEIIKTAADWQAAYAGNGWHVALLAAALVYIVLQKEKEPHRRLIAGFAGLFTAVYFCPVTAGIVMKCVGSNVYWRMMWVLPVPLIISYAAVRICSNGKSAGKRICTGVLLAALICLTGKNVYFQGSPYEKAVNFQKVPSTPAAICEIVRMNLSEGEEARLAAPEDIVGYVRQYDAGIKQTYGRRGRERHAWRGIRRRINAQLRGEQVNYDELVSKLRKSGSNFIVLGPAAGTREAMAKRGFESVGEAGAYTVYKDMQ